MESATSARRVTGKERAAQAVELRKAGLTYAQIGAQLGITEQGAFNAVKRAMIRMNTRLVDGVEGLRRIEIERLDKMLAAIWGQALQGNLGAVDRVIRIQERRAKLLGLDAPVSIDLYASTVKAYVGISPDDWDPQDGNAK